MWPFKRKPNWEETYAQRIYDGLVVHNDFGNVTALSLRIPTALHQSYQNKILLQRELVCFFALMVAAKPETRLPPVMFAFGDLLISKLGARGIQMNRNQLTEHAQADAVSMLEDPFAWAQRWLAEFRDDPEDNFMVALFADHCTRLFNACKTGIETTQPK